MSADAGAFAAVFDMEPTEAIAFLKGKGHLITWNWHDALNETHARAFTVAKAGKLAVLEEIAAALKRMPGEKEFIRQLKPELQKLGWWGIKEVVRPDGETVKAQLGSVRRLETIYRTNMQSAMMAARDAQMREAVDTHPYWQYVAVLDGRTRPTHRMMDGRVFRWDDADADRFGAPNGFRCRCRKKPVSESRVRRDGLTVERTEGRLVQVEKPVSQEKSVTVTGIRMKEGATDFIFSPDAGFDAPPGGWRGVFEREGVS